jgi:L-amino acid N-acyltransferase YncA
MIEVQVRHTKVLLMICILSKDFSYGAGESTVAAMPTATASIVIREATQDDIPAIARIYRHAVLHGTASFEIDPPDEREMSGRFDALKAGGFPFVVAHDDGAVLGYACAGPYRARPAYRHTVEDSIYVSPEAHRRGVGRRLLAALLDQATAAGFRQMIAGIGDSRNAASIGLHEALGFAPIGVARSVGFKHGRWLDHVLMQRSLGMGDRSPPDA